METWRVDTNHDADKPAWQKVQASLLHRWPAPPRQLIKSTAGRAASSGERPQGRQIRFPYNVQDYKKAHHGMRLQGMKLV